MRGTQKKMGQVFRLYGLPSEDGYSTKAFSDHRPMATAYAAMLFGATLTVYGDALAQVSHLIPY